MNLCEQVPLHRMRLKGIENYIAPIAIVKAREIAAVRIRNDCAIAAFERAMQKLADRGGFSCSGRADELEMLSLIERSNADASERH